MLQPRCACAAGSGVVQVNGVHCAPRLRSLEDGGVGAGEKREGLPVPWGKHTEGKGGRVKGVSHITDLPGGFFFLPSSHALQLGAPLPVNNFIWPCCHWGPLIKLSHPFCLWQLLTI